MTDTLPPPRTTGLAASREYGASPLERPNGAVERCQSDSEARLAIQTAMAFVRSQGWLIVGLPLIVALASAATAGPPAHRMRAMLSVAVDIPRSAIVVGSDEGTAAKIGEALIDDLSRIIAGDVFAAAVADRLPDGIDVHAGEVASSLSATDRHRVADISVTRAVAPDATSEQRRGVERELMLVADAVVAELLTNGNEWFARLGEDRVVLTVVDRPKVSVLAPDLRDRLAVPLRVALALAVGLALSLARHFMDPHLHTDRDALEATGASVVGRIPRPRGRRTRPW